MRILMDSEGNKVPPVKALLLAAENIPVDDETVDALVDLAERDVANVREARKQAMRLEDHERIDELLAQVEARLA